MIVIGLTGSIGMGKSTTARMFAEAGVLVWSADEAVHRLYARGGAAVEAVRALFPEAVVDDAVDRVRLSRMLQADRADFVRLEQAVHPLVGADRAAFLRRAAASGADVAVVDIPLLFETGAERDVDLVVVVSAPAAVQRQRVLDRESMDEAKLAAILERQTPDAHKRDRADVVIDTSLGLAAARRQVRDVLDRIGRKAFPPRSEAVDEGDEPPQ